MRAIYLGLTGVLALHYWDLVEVVHTVVKLWLYNAGYGELANNFA